MGLRTTNIDAYPAEIVLWVEDDLTRVLLTEFWQDTHIKVKSAGGSDAVAGLVESAPHNWRGKHIVGLVDRDFGFDNHDRWKDSAVSVLRLPVHEAENLLLDFEVLAAITKTHTAAQISSVAINHAQAIRWWLTSKHVLHELCVAVTAHFPKDPPLTLRSQDEASSHIISAPYWKEHSQALATWSPKQKTQYIEERVAQVGADYERDLTNGGWVNSFSGKEILRQVRTEIDGLCQLMKQGSTPAENDADLAELFARKLRDQRLRHSSPTATLLVELRAALRHRAGLPR